MTYEQLPEEWQEWIKLTPMERFRRSELMFVEYLALGGSLDPDPDPNIPFDDAEHGVRALLMDGQACVFYGAAQVSKDVDFAILADDENSERLHAVLIELDAERVVSA